MLKQIFALKHFFPWKDLITSLRTMKRARSPLRGYVTTLCIWTLIDIGLWELLAKGSSVSLEDFAHAEHLQINVLRSVCHYLNRLSYLNIDGDQVRLSKKGRRFWNQVYGTYHLFHAYEPIFSTLVGQLRGTNVFGQDLSRLENEVAQGFDELGQQFMFPILEGVINDIGFKGVIDLGCGEAYLSTFLCRRHPTMKCLGIDSNPEILEKARHKIQKLRFESRIALLLADMFQLDQEQHDFSHYQVVTAIDLFHGYFLEGEEVLIKLFKTFHRVFTRQSLLISEICLPSAQRMKHIAYPYVEHEFFHDLTKQKSFVPGELEALLERSGYRIQRKWNLNEIAGRVCLLLQRQEES